MAYNNSWLLEDRIVHSYVYGKSTADDVIAFSEDLYEKFLMNSGQPIHIIFDSTELISMPYSVKNLNEAVRAVYSHENLGWVVFVGLNSPMMRMIIAVVSQVGKVRMKEVETMEQALYFLHRVDLTLPEQAENQTEL